MTQSREDLTLAPIELVVLARCSSPRAPTEKALAQAVLELAMPAELATRPKAEATARATEAMTAALLALRRRALLVERHRTPTEAGYRTLRAALGLNHVPGWAEIRSLHLPARALRLSPEAAGRALRTGATIVTSLLCQDLKVATASTVDELCDNLITEALGLPPGRLTLAGLRTAVLAKRAGVEARGSATSLGALISKKRLGIRAGGSRGPTKKELLEALGRRALDGATGEVAVVDPPPPPPPETLLSVVRDTLPRVGPDGRYGSEKVFVSAIWHNLERDRRIKDLSLDRFKRWLVNANREGQLILARADLVGAMDAKLVADSAIEDQGATFHFVLDQHNQAARQPARPHAR